MTSFLDISSRLRRGLRDRVDLAGQIKLVVDLDTDQGARQVSVDLALAGPDQMVALAPGAVRRRVPADGSGDHRAGELPYVEFHDPGLPWALSFGTAPTLGLICLPEGEGVTLQAGAVPNAILSVSGLGHRLPHPSLFALMAHVQGAGPGAVSRILCPQELRPHVSYLAALVPLTAAGRDAGLGLAPPEGMTGDGGAAWDPGDAQITLPALDWWRFSTGSGRSVQDILRDLRPHGLGAGVQTLPLDDASADLLGLLRGARLPRATLLTDAPQTFPELDALVPALTPKSPDGTPRLPLPSYGGLHAEARDAGEGFVPGRDPAWFRQLNRTPSLRIMAGHGAELVRRHQDEMVGFVRRAAGQIADANMLLGRAFAGLRVGAQLHAQLSRLPDEALLRLAGPAAART
ncbi:hypothetical protein E4L95_22770, partial [Paracoccus liaowanqingii]